MKRKVWVSSPVFYLITAAMLGMAIASWFWSPIAFYVELGVCVLSVAAVFVAVRQFRSYVDKIMQGTRSALFGKDYRALREFALPLVIVGSKDDIVWGNPAFLKAMGWDKEDAGRSLDLLIHPYTLEQLLEAAGTEIQIENHCYTVFATRIEEGCLLYWVDDTAYKQLSREYADTRPIVAMACFDNREELLRDASGSEESRINSEVETTLSDWAHSMGGFFKKLSGGSRFLILTDEKNIMEAKKKRFAVLDQIRGIKTSDDRSATVSVGIGKGAGTLAESELWARQALDMALGRGGDQVAIKQESDDYEFFGGLSKGVEKRDKVRTRVIAASLSDHIKASDVVLVMGHKFSDLDALGSAIGMWSAAAKGLKKTAYVVVNRSQTMAMSLIKNMEATMHDGDRAIFIPPSEALPLVTPKTLLIVTDTHSPDFVESQDLLHAVERVVVIDHHRMMVKHITNAIVFYHEPYASSASEMVAELVQYIGNNPLSRAEAEALMAGIMLDTKGFVMRCGVRTFDAASYLRRRGADTVEVKRLFSESIETYKAKFRLVSAAEVYDTCAIACAQEETPDIRVIAAQAADELLAIQGVMVSFVIFPMGDDVSISARSLGDVNVQLIMEALGGGGHLTMAGTMLSDTTIKDTKARLLETLKETLPLATKFPSVNTSRV